MFIKSYTYSKTLVENGLRTQLAEQKLLIADKYDRGSSSSPVIKKKKKNPDNSLVVHWLGHHTFGRLRFSPGWETEIPQPHSATKKKFSEIMGYCFLLLKVTKIRKKTVLYWQEQIGIHMLLVSLLIGSIFKNSGTMYPESSCSYPLNEQLPFYANI